MRLTECGVGVTTVTTYQLQRQHGLVSVWEVGVHGHDHAVRDDGQDDAILERSAIDQPLYQASETSQIN